MSYTKKSTDVFFQPQSRVLDFVVNRSKNPYKKLTFNNFKTALFTLQVEIFDR